MLIPPLPDGQVAILATVGEDGPVAIPVSAIRRRGPDRLLIALAGRRASVTRMRADPRVGVSLTGPGVALAIEGTARIVADPLPGAENMVAVEIEVRNAWDARSRTTAVDDGIRWHWTDRESADRHEAVLAALDAFNDGIEARTA